MVTCLRVVRKKITKLLKSAKRSIYSLQSPKEQCNSLHNIIISIKNFISKFFGLAYNNFSKLTSYTF